jgi:leader peptidase (prepilin peptidase) / N-methyltransferase
MNFVDWVELLHHPGVWPALAGLFGLLVGSFANVCIHRIPRGDSIVYPGSACPRCGHRLAAWENLPLLSFLALRGRCRQCHERISWRYPLVEVANGLLWLGLALQLAPGWRALFALLFVTALLVLSLIDLEHFILPDVITFPGIATGLVASVMPGSPIGPLESLASAAGAYLAFLLVAKAYERLRGVEGLGQGDWKMAAMLGAFLGWQGLLLTVLLASVGGTAVGLALVLRGRAEGFKAKIPLGTFLGLAGIGVLFAGGPVLRWYRALLGV